MVKPYGVKVLPLLVLVLVLTGLMEQGQSHPCGSTFYSSLIQLTPCREAVAPFSPIQPSEACCNSVKALGQPCFCTLVNDPPISGVDRNMALQLPDKCTANFEPCEIMKKEDIEHGRLLGVSVWRAPFVRITVMLFGNKRRNSC